MKKILILAVVFGLTFSSTAFSQNNENIKKETTVKKVTVKDTGVKTIVEKDVKEEVSVVKVEGTEKTNQDSEVQVVKDVKTTSVNVVDEGVNLENQAKLEKEKKKEYERIDGQQRGVPIQTSDDVQAKPLKKEKSKKDDGNH